VPGIPAWRQVKTESEVLMKPELLTHDLFLLMINLSQLSSCEAITSAYTASLESMIPDATFTVEDTEPDGYTGDSIEIATLNRQMGWLVVDYGDQVPPEERKVLIRNSVKMLAIILDNCLNRIEAASTLRRTELVLSDAFNFAPIGMAVVDTDGCFQSANTAFCEMVGYSEGELQKKRFLDITPEDDHQISSNAISSMISGETQRATYEKAYLHKDGHRVDCRVTSTLMRHESGEPLHFITQIQDISEQRRAEKKRNQLEAQLRQAHKMEAVGTLAGGIAHDFNNILSIILGNLELATESNEASPDRRISLNEIKIASLRATDMVRQLLSFSHVDEPTREPIAVDQIVNESLKLARAALPASMEIKNQIRPDIGVIEANATQIHEVIINLCTNAFQAMEDGRGSLTIDAFQYSHDERHDTAIPHMPYGEYISLSITDNGGGIEPEMLERIYDPYFTTKPVGKGTGMGLAIVQGIVRNHHGTITVTSDVGRGTSVTIYIPRIEKPILLEVAAPMEVPTGNERILLIDDEVMLINMGRRVLTNLGYQVDAMSNSRKALAEFTANPDDFDLIITDMTMPEMMGDQLATEILKSRPDMPIILCTGYSEYIDKERAEAIGIKHYIEKPVDIGELARIVRQTIDEAKAALLD
jgi:PAS domain S-box-containing protein